ncbi:MarR family winged helix-turn-helix transcriptional regulator [Amycolatopsis sp. BJA-103]|uniref:MarR family winged helix-turn-helix transcriptional regulator n=1 Tax=Amycolatopsis sp. BJA-103 TaxID=1911175 RepID=UPI000C79218F|nr:MarR family transcriptional regulator [Amycolatopsis sp. BJA-103]AUI58895.1 MarR family transcriptional regulator [Amycolatopsis sp. BJA-103]PNE17653.1 MarR family transcriptional regulator [Amycolatopsis sp. BJA-103]
MKAGELYLLGKHLMELASHGMRDDADPEVPEIDLVLISVIVEAPDISISELTARTGFAQSHVSTAVAKLREQGALRTRPDPADRRRTLVTPVDELITAVAQRQQRDAEQVLAAALAELEPEADSVADRAARLVKAADELYRLLTDRALRVGEGSALMPLHSLAGEAAAKPKK